MTAPPLAFADGAPMFTPYEGKAIPCPAFPHLYPSAAGTCPEHTPPAVYPDMSLLPGVVPGATPPGFLQGMYDLCVLNKDTGKAPRASHAYGYENRKIGMVQHIPVCDTLEQLTGYFNGGAALGSTHYGVGRHAFKVFAYEWNGKRYRIPLTEVHRYMPVEGPRSPWAQGIIQTSSACALSPAPIIRGMGSGVPNGAFVSVENVARTGSQGMTDPQFNANVLLRAIHAIRWNYPITPTTQLWHGEIDQKDRCFDPGWDGALEDEAQAAAVALTNGDPTLLRGMVIETITPPPNPTPTPTVDPFYLAELQAQIHQTRWEATLAITEADELRNAKVSDLMDLIARHERRRMEIQQIRWDTVTGKLRAVGEEPSSPRPE